MVDVLELVVVLVEDAEAVLVLVMVAVVVVVVVMVFVVVVVVDVVVVLQHGGGAVSQLPRSKSGQQSMYDASFLPSAHPLSHLHHPFE